MTIVEALKCDDFRFAIDRISQHPRWLYWDIEANEWVVLESRRGSHGPYTLYRGTDEGKAVSWLTGNKGEDAPTRDTAGEGVS